MTSDYSISGSGTHHDGSGTGSDTTCGPTGPGCENMIFLGNLADMDPYENNIGAEVDSVTATLGGNTYGSGSNPLYQDIVQVTANDTNGDNLIMTNDLPNTGSSETITHDADGDGISSDYQIDSSFVVQNAQITFLNEDGSTSTIATTARVMQDTAGNTFLMPPSSTASQAEIDLMTSRPIVSVTFPTNKACYDLCHDSIFTDRTCFPCFVRGTLIETEHGPVAVEDMVPGMRVKTRDRGLQPVRWIGSRVLSHKMLAIAANMRPIRISAGALGRGMPQRDLLVSPQHRILVRSKIAHKMFGAPEVLVAAKQLLQIDGIDIVQNDNSVEYFHFLFDQHEIVLSEGAETESLYTGKEALKSIGQSAQEEIFALFPELRNRNESDVPAGVRILASGRMGRKLAVRHAQHKKVLVQ